MPSSTRATHHGANDADRSPTTTVRDALSRSTPSTTRSISRRPRGKDRHRRNARSNSTESRRPQGNNRRCRNARSSSAESSRPRGQNRHHRLAHSSPTELSRRRRQDRRRRHARGSRSRGGTEEGNRVRNHQRGKRTRDPSWEHPLSRSRSRGRREHTTRDHARIQRSGSRKHHEGDRLAGTTPCPNRRDRRRRSHDPRGRSRGRSQSRNKRGHEHSPPRQRDAPRTPKWNRRAYTFENRPREERERTNLSDAMYMIQRAARDRTHIARPLRGDAERDGALWGQHTPANLWGGPRTEAHPLMIAHEAGRYGRVRVEAPITIDQLRQWIRGALRSQHTPAVIPPSPRTNLKHTVFRPLTEYIHNLHPRVKGTSRKHF